MGNALRQADEIGRVSGLDAWLAAYHTDLDYWAFRTRLAAFEIEAIARWRLGKDA